jgi:hypothetical protein
VEKFNDQFYFDTEPITKILMIFITAFVIYLYRTIQQHIYESTSSTSDMCSNLDLDTARLGKKSIKSSIVIHTTILSGHSRALLQPIYICAFKISAHLRCGFAILSAQCEPVMNTRIWHNSIISQRYSYLSQCSVGVQAKDFKCTRLAILLKIKPHLGLAVLTQFSVLLNFTSSPFVATITVVA